MRWNRRRFVGAANRRAKQEKQTWSRRGSDTDRSEARNIRTTNLKENGGEKKVQCPGIIDTTGLGQKDGID
jgi:hypothetical protein